MEKPKAVGIVPLGGGPTLGMEKAGFDVVRNFEIAGYGANLEHNRPGVPTHYATGDDLSEWEKWAETQAEDPPVVAFGSPPCQGFSGMNSRSGPDAAKNVWLTNFTNAAIQMGATYALAENIPRSLSLGRKVVNEMQDICRRGGYNFSIHRHNVWDFGVSQQRRRVMFVMEKKGSEMVWPEPPQLEKSEAMPLWDTISDFDHIECTPEHMDEVVLDEPQNPYQASLRSEDDTTINHQLMPCPERFEHVPWGCQWMAMPDEYKTDKDRARIAAGTIFNAVEPKRPNPNKVGPTVTGAINMIHPYQTRFLTVREASRVMGFPDTWEWLMPKNYQQMAAGVCPQVIEHFGWAIQRQLSGEKQLVLEGRLF